jgi:hypothetical protein
MARKTPKKKMNKRVKIAAKQEKSKVGYKKPPKEHQFKPGQSGNPNGPPMRKTNLWVWFCKYMALTDAQLQKLDRSSLAQAQQTALKLVENMKEGKGSGFQRLALSVFDREEGRAVEHFVIEKEDALTDLKCEQIRKMLIKKAK